MVSTMKKRQVLLVDDEPSIRTVLSAILQASGYDVTTAEDGFAALRAIRASIPDLIISDMRMPNMNGFELLAVVREKFPAIPVIAISGEFVGEQVEGVLADVFLQKGTYSPLELLQRIGSLLDLPASERKRIPSHNSSVWASTGDSPAMVTCSECLKSFPMDPCEISPGRESDKTVCIFCGAQLQYRLIAITRPA
jgi:CheY-like chemotaxis protein